MKTLRYLFALLCLATASLASAQVVEFHVNENYHNDGQTHVYKFYLSGIDSIVYVPALDWTPTVEIKDYYEDEQGQTHVRVHATTGPDADFARLYFAEKAINSSYFSSADVYPERDTLTNYTPLEKGCDLEMDFVLPDPTQKYWVTLATANLRYYPSYYRGFVTSQCLIDYTYWQEMGDWKEMGNAIYREDLVGALFNVDNLEYEVEIQKHGKIEGLYRLVNPYCSAYPYNDPPDYDESTNHYMVIHAEDPDHVWFETHYSGMDWGYGEFRFTSVIGYQIGLGYSLEDLIASSSDLFGTMVDGVITMPVKSMMMSMADYSDGGWFYANRNGLLAVALPGYSSNAQGVPRKNVFNEMMIPEAETGAQPVTEKRHTKLRLLKIEGNDAYMSHLH